MLAVWLFFLAGPFAFVKLPTTWVGALVCDALLSLVFFLQHSVMARRAFQRWLSRYLPTYYYGALYTIASGVVLLAVVGLWQESGIELITFGGPAWWPMRTVFVLAMAGMAWAFLSLDSFDSFGLNPLRERLWGTVSPLPSFVVRGPYRWVRHPLYFCTFIFIWSCPNVTLDRLFFNLTWTVWIVVGALLEERNLLADFGDTYKDYQRRVPMLIPYRLRPHVQKNIG